AGGCGGLDQRKRGIKSAGSSSFGLRHQRFESAAEHLRVDGGFVPGGRFFARGETIFAKHRRDQSTVRIIREHDAAVPSLHWRARKKAAVEKRNLAERSGSWCALTQRCVERSEKERPQDAIVKSPATLHAAIELMGDE